MVTKNDDCNWRWGPIPPITPLTGRWIFILSHMRKEKLVGRSYKKSNFKLTHYPLSCLDCGDSGDEKGLQVKKEKYSFSLSSVITLQASLKKVILE
jgi:hypothetical protein